LQLWSTMELLVGHHFHHVPYHTLRNTVFQGDDAPLRALIDHDILGCRIGKMPTKAGTRADMHVDHMYVTPFSPLLLNVFRGLINDPRLKQMIDLIRDEEAQEERSLKERKEREALDAIQKALAVEKSEVLQSIEIWKALEEHSDPERTRKMLEHLLNFQEHVIRTEGELLQAKRSLDTERNKDTASK